MQSASATLFDEAYYQRFYFDKRPAWWTLSTWSAWAFVCSYLKYLRVPVRRVLDVGCGIGLWKGIVERHFPAPATRAWSSALPVRALWLAAGFGGRLRRQRAVRLGDLPGRAALPEPGRPESRAAQPGPPPKARCMWRPLRARTTSRDIIDEDLTDNRVFRHRAELYRRGLREGFVELGGGVWLSRQAEVPMFALEHVGG